MTVAVSEKGALRYQRSIGFATIENGVPQRADAGTRYWAGPVSTLFTAVMVMQRVETASITLDSPLAEFYPDLPNALHITYRDLLAQRSGLANYTAAADFASWRTRPKTRIEMLDLIANAGARFAPRERVEYSDSNYLVLGFMLETIQDRSYDDILVRQIVGKLGMSRTYFAGTGNARLESRPYRHTPSGWVAAEQTDPSVAGGALGVVSTPTDLVRFIDALFKGELVSAQSLESMRNQDGGSGLGLSTHEIAGQTGLGQSGGIDGFTASVYHFPARGISIACMSNAAAVPMKDIVDQLLTTVLVRGYRPSSPAVTPAE
jgi:CubicO group peptidase (beta-lactamase class C family)